MFTARSKTQKESECRVNNIIESVTAFQFFRTGFIDTHVPNFIAADSNIMLLNEALSDGFLLL